MRRSQWVAVSIAGALLLVDVAALVVSLLIDQTLVERGYGDRVDIIPSPWVYLVAVAVLSPAAVGLAIVRTHPRHAVGWLFAGLSVSLVATILVDEWFSLSAVLDPPALGGARVAAVLGDKSFYPWWPILTLILLLTPTGTYLSPRWRLVGSTSVVASVVSFVFSVVSDHPLNAPYDAEGNPWTIDAIAGPAGTIGLLTFGVVAVALVLGGVALVARWRSSDAEGRRQLLWLALAGGALPALVPLHLYAVFFAHDSYLVLASVALFLVLIPVTAGLAVLRYRLYDVDRIVAATTTYSLLSMLLSAVFAGIVWIGSRITWEDAPSPETTAAVGAITAALLFAPLRSGVQQRVDRRFNRRAYDATRVVRRALAEDRAGLDPQELLRTALADPSIAVSYPGVEGPVDAAGRAAAPRPHEVAVLREGSGGGRVVAWIGYDRQRTEEHTVARVGALVAAELDNTRLRAELRRHLTELDRSRARIAEAQREERRRIECDLHDGAQQSLLALAFDLQTAQLSGDTDRMQRALAAGATSARDAVRDLRDLANGLHPQALVEGGLAAVLDDVARHSPVPLHVTAPPDRWDPAVEFTAWLVTAEAVVNAQKHAGAARIDVAVRPEGRGLRLRVADDGCGGADDDSSGLRGLRDRVEASGGTVTITSIPGAGTTIEAVLPCGS
ncbi:sensor histidine kinase [Nocardioides sp. MH1]|uniref:sensor histidine kinase n=1 Tax=Nocardioides sp. MH1 TaxID=3242490 RepID=UPI0035203DCA